jgi:hypothetical protein
MRFAAQKDRECSSWLDAIKFVAEPHPEIESWMAKIGYDYTESPRQSEVDKTMFTVGLIAA